MSPSFFRVVLAAILFVTVLVQSSNAQKDTITPDTVKIEQVQNVYKHSPTKAALFSTFVPGLGQIYNRKYWKVPIIYAGMGIPFYYGLEQHELFVDKRNAYTSRLAGDSTDKYLEPGNFFTNEGLLSSMDINRRNRDLMIIIAGVVYVLQIVDATVDAHMFYFNVSDDLSIHYTPTFYYDRREQDMIKGLSLSLHF